MNGTKKSKIHYEEEKVLITGSAGLIGSEAVRFFCGKGFDVHGIDNNMRKYFFGVDGDTSWMRKKLSKEEKLYVHHTVDIRDEKKIGDIFKKIDLI